MKPNRHQIYRFATAALCAAACCSLAGCATQTLPITGKGAQLDIQLSNDATGSVLQSWHVRKFSSERCDKVEDGILLSKEAFSKGATSMAPITLPTGDKITLAFRYFDAHLGVNMGCNYTLTFVPVEAQHYTARFAVTGNVSSCTVAIADAAGKKIDVATPVRSCVSGSVATDSVLNGTGRVTVPPRPAVIYYYR